MFKKSDVGINLNLTRKFTEGHELYCNAADTLFHDIRETIVHQPNHALKGLVNTLTAEKLIPVFFLYRHALELQLKKILALLDTLEAEKTKKSKSGHDLKKLWKSASTRLPEHFANDQEAVLLDPLDSKLSYIFPFIESFHKMDINGENFRYPDEEGKRENYIPFDIRRFENSYKVVTGTFNEIINGLEAFIDKGYPV